MTSACTLYRPSATQRTSGHAAIGAPPAAPVCLAIVTRRSPRGRPRPAGTVPLQPAAIRSQEDGPGNLTAGLLRLKLATMRRLAPELLVTAQRQRREPREVSARPDRQVVGASAAG